MSEYNCGFYLSSIYVNIVSETLTILEIIAEVIAIVIDVIDDVSCGLAAT